MNWTQLMIKGSFFWILCSDCRPSSFQAEQGSSFNWSGILAIQAPLDSRRLEEIFCLVFFYNTIVSSYCMTLTSAEYIETPQAEYWTLAVMVRRVSRATVAIKGKSNYTTQSSIDCAINRAIKWKLLLDSLSASLATELRLHSFVKERIERIKIFLSIINQCLQLGE